MKLVRENIEFKRGQDPKKSLDIGLNGIIKNKLQQVLDTDSWNVYNRIEIPESQDHIFVEFIDAATGGGRVLGREMREAGLGEYVKLGLVSHAINRGTHDWYGEESVYRRYGYKFEFKPKYKGLIGPLSIEKSRGLRENIEFKRGIEPKKSLGLGLRKEIIQKLTNAIKDEPEWWAFLDGAYERDGYLHITGTGPDFNKTANRAMKIFGLYKYLENKVGETVIRKEEKKYRIKEEFKDIFKGIQERTTHEIS